MLQVQRKFAASNYGCTLVFVPDLGAFGIVLRAVGAKD